MFKTKVINDKIVKPIELDSNITKPLKSYDIFPINYYNLFILAKKASGKTVTLFNILKHSASKSTNIVVFSSTIHSDNSWVSILKYFKKKKINLITYQSLIDEGVNQLDELITFLLNQNNKEDSDEEECVKATSCLFDEVTEEKEIKPKKDKICGPDYILVFDDLSTELQNIAIEKLTKINRHIKCQVIMSSQYMNNITKSTRLNLDFIILFKAIPEEKLKQIHLELDLSTDYCMFKRLYDFATSGSYNFLYVNIRNEEYRQNFNKKIEFNN